MMLAVRFLNVELIGINSQGLYKLLLTIGLIVAVLLINFLLGKLPESLIAKSWKQTRFWIRQIARLLAAVVFVVGIASIWFNDSARLATFFGLFSAGVAFALQKVITAFAGYFVILRGRSFRVGDRIVMGGVRGDVIGVGFIQTMIMEMGQPPGVSEQTDPAMWVRARQYTGRIVTITNDKIFDQPVYNYTREFPYIWDEIMIPISYKDDRSKAERIIMDAAEQHTVMIRDLSEEAIADLQKRFQLRRTDIGPRVYFRLTDNWVEMTVRFICLDHGVRDVKDKMSRQIIDALDEAKIGIASSTYDIVGMPPIKVEMAGNGDGNVRSIAPAKARES